MALLPILNRLTQDRPTYLEQNFDLLAGSYPSGMNDIILIVDNKNGIDKPILRAFGFDHKAESIAFDDIIGYEVRALPNNDFYKRIGNLFTMNGDPANLNDLYHTKNAIKLKGCRDFESKRGNGNSSHSSWFCLF